MKTIILNIFSRILKLCRCVFLLDVYLFYVLMYVLQEIFPSWPIPFNNQYTCRLTNEVPRFEMSTFSNSQLSANYADYKTQPGMVCQLKISSSGQLYPHHSK